LSGLVIFRSLGKVETELVFVKNAPIFNHVRLQKFILRFKKNGFLIDYWCWQREKSEVDPNNEEKYLLFGGGYGGWKLIFWYPIWVFLVFFRALSSKQQYFFVVDFESAFPFFVASKFRADIHYIYDIHDDFAMRYSFPQMFRSLIERLDRAIKKSALRVIHVDPSRVRENDLEHELVYNAPDDFLSSNLVEQHVPKYDQGELKLAMAGLLSYGRGAQSLIDFKTKNPATSILIAGKAVDKVALSLCKCSGVEYLGEIDQAELFQQLVRVNCLVALYDPRSEINRFAASNKLYDALMLGKPIIVSDCSTLSDFVRKNEVGVVVNFHFDTTWDVLEELKDPAKRKKMSIRARELYLSQFSPEINLDPAVDRISKLIINSQTSWSA
jgi:glycosyltransferase involved in cell wall biosynthesis